MTEEDDERWYVFMIIYIIILVFNIFHDLYCRMKDLENALCEKDMSPLSEESEHFNVIANECRGQVWRQLLKRDDDTVQTLLDEKPVIKNIEQLEVDCQMLIGMPI